MAELDFNKLIRIELERINMLVYNSFSRQDAERLSGEAKSNMAKISEIVNTTLAVMNNSTFKENK